MRRGETCCNVCDCEISGGLLDWATKHARCPFCSEPMSVTRKPNARFWVYAFNAPVKVTLKPGQFIEWSEGGITDEGYHVEHVRLAYPDTEPPHVVRAATTDARDCDGRLQTFHDEQCPLSDLAAHEVEMPYTDYVLIHGEVEEVKYPRWQEIHASQRDHSAEAMGY